MHSDHASVLAELAEMIRATLGEFGADVEIIMDTTFREELGMESIDVVGDPVGPDQAHAVVAGAGADASAMYVTS
jgi:hypothetical protein